MRTLGFVMLSMSLAGVASAAVVSTTTHGADSTSLNAMISVGDLISGKIGVEQPGDQGWHPANGQLADQLPAFTDDAGIRASGLTGLLNDFPPSGQPAKLVRYDLGGAANIGSIGILTGNNGKDGRIFSTTVIRYSTDGGANFNVLGYFQSDPSGTLNNAGSNPRYGSTYVKVYNDASATLLSGVTNIQFDLYGVDNTGGQMRDPFDGVNPFTGLDDGLNAPNSSPLVFELDVNAVPEPMTLGLMALGGLLLARRRGA